MAQPHYRKGLQDDRHLKQEFDRERDAREAQIEEEAAGQTTNEAARTEEAAPIAPADTAGDQQSS